MKPLTVEEFYALKGIIKRTKDRIRIVAFLEEQERNQDDRKNRSI